MPLSNAIKISLTIVFEWLKKNLVLTFEEVFFFFKEKHDIYKCVETHGNFILDQEISLNGPNT